MRDLSDYENLSHIPGFATLRKKISASNDQREQRDFLNQLRIAKKLDELPGLKLIEFEYGKPPKDILFEYKNERYNIEVKTIHRTNKAKKLDKPPFTTKPKRYANTGSNQIPEIPPDYDVKDIRDKIIDAYPRLPEGCLNIIVIMVQEPWWLVEFDAEDAWRLMFKNKNSEERKKLNAMVFGGGFASNCKIFENPKVTEVDQQLKSHMEKILFE